MSPAPTRMHGGTFRLGTIAGIPLLISPWTLAVIALVAIFYGPGFGAAIGTLSTAEAYGLGAIAGVLLELSVLIHEFAHAAAGRAFGIRVHGVTLWALGGFTEMDEPSTPIREFAVAVVGPLASLAIAGAGFLGVIALPGHSVVHVLVAALTLSNLLVGVFNLLPGIPLDGGRVFRAVVWGVTKNPSTSLAVAGWAGRVLAGFLAAYGGAVYLNLIDPLFIAPVFAIVIALYVWTNASAAIRLSQLRQRFPLLDASRLATPALLVPPDLPLAEALRRATEAGLPSVVIVDEGLRPTALVSAAAVDATPVERRPWVPVSAVGRTLHTGLVLPAHLRGEDVLRAVQASPATEYLVVDGDPDRGGRVVGVLAASAVADALRP